MIFENKVAQKLKLLKKKDFLQKWSPKLIFFNESFFFEKIPLILTQKIDFESTISALFDDEP